MDTESSRVAIVTGAGSSVGRASALTLLGDGYRVALAGRRRHLLEAVAQASGAGERALVVPTDVADPSSVRALFDACVKAFGRVDVVFNNTGQNMPGADLESLSLGQWKQVIDVNVTGVFLYIQQAFRVMKAQVPQGGRIINNGSLSAHTPRPRSIPYSTSKHAVTGMTKTAALDGRPYNIAVGQINIGNASSDMADRMKQGVLQANGEVRVEPLIDPAIVGRSVLYMASLPLEANVLFHTVMATHMPFVGRG